MGLHKKKIKKDDRYFIIRNKKIEESSNAIYMRYFINTYFYIINEVNDKEL